MLLERLPSAGHPAARGKNTGAIGAAKPETKQPARGLCSLLGEQGGGGLSRVGTAEEQGPQSFEAKML